jgi:hypothetical protein
MRKAIARALVAAGLLTAVALAPSVAVQGASAQNQGTCGFGTYYEYHGWWWYTISYQTSNVGWQYHWHDGQGINAGPDHGQWTYCGY